MIKSLTPYYINIPLVSPLTGATAISYVINLFVWNGAKNDPPTEPQYQITKTNPTASTGTDKINISNLINDFIEFTPNKSTVTELNDGNNQVWVRQEIEYITTDEDDEGVLQLAETNLCLKGYGYGLSGENPQPPTNKILIPIQDYKVNRNGFFNVPILIDEPVDTSELVITDIENTSGSTYAFSFTSNFTINQLYVRVRLNESSDWGAFTLFSGTTSPQSRIVSLGGGTWQAEMRSLNEATGTTVFSNIFTFTP
jgi:hypothetical protein